VIGGGHHASASFFSCCGLPSFLWCARAPPPLWTLPQSRLRGAALDRAQLHTLAISLVRVRELSTHRAEIAAAQPKRERRETHDYYLRKPPPSGSVDVDHTFECQLLAFAIESAEPAHRLLASIGATDFTPNEPLSKQAEGVKAAFRPLHAAHNDVRNLRLLDSSVNRSKGSVFKTCIALLVAGRRAEAEGAKNVMGLMVSHFCALKDDGGGRLLDPDAADGLAKLIGREILNVKGAYVAAIRAAALEASGKGSARRDAAKFYRAVADNVVQIYDVMGLHQ